MPLILTLHRAGIKQPEAIKLGNVGNTSSELIQKDSSFVDNMEALFNYAKAFYLECSVRFVDACIKNIAIDARSSEYLPSMKMPACDWYTWLAKLYLKKDDLLPELEMVSITVS